jgi:tellurite resistance protein
LIIFGSRGVTYNYASGEFHCPSCRAGTPYRHKRVRRFFTLYFIPLIPLDLLGEYIECQDCLDTFHIDVLEYDGKAESDAFEAEFQIAVKRVMVMMMMADGRMDDHEVQTIKEIYSKIAGVELSDLDLAQEVANEDTDITGYLQTVVGSLNDQGKELVVKAALLVAAADGEFQEEERELLHRIGLALEMSPAHLDGVIGEMLTI